MSSAPAALPKAKASAPNSSKKQRPAPAASAAKKPAAPSTPNPAKPDASTKGKRQHQKPQGTSKTRIARETPVDGAVAAAGQRGAAEKRIVAIAQPRKSAEGKKQKDGADKKQLQKSTAGKRSESKVAAKQSSWRLSPSLAGRYSRLDPVFAKNEKHIFLAHTDTLKVFSVKTSLLVRSITLPPSSPARPETIVSYFLDSRADNQVYAATSKGQLYLWDWLSGALVRKWKLGLLVHHLAMCADQDQPAKDEFYAVDEKRKTVWRLRLPADGSSEVGKVRVVDTMHSVSALRVCDGGNAVVAGAGHELVIVNRGDEDAWMTPRRYNVTHFITDLDVNMADLSQSAGRKGAKGGRRGRGDVVVADTTGALHVFHDVVRHSNSPVDPVVRRLHWHRTAAQAVKWALDGNYVISGGSETVLVLWQIETGMKQFLPHLGSKIENIVVSPDGRFYAVSLADNSTMVLSTTDLKPKANIAGIQSAASLVGDAPTAIRVPCLLHPAQANSLLLATPSTQHALDAPTPYLENFDTFSDRHIARQALTRTTATIVNQGPDSTRIREPSIVHLAITPDGAWLASVDEWTPSSSDDCAPHQSPPHAEIFLKFWRWSDKAKEWDLVTRVDVPHPAAGDLGSERILDLIAAPASHAFITAGADGSARVWKPKAKTHAGVPVRGEAVGAHAVSWSCKKIIPFARARVLDVAALTAADDESDAALQVAKSKSSLDARWWGRVALSEDGSVLAVAAPVPGSVAAADSVIHLINAHSGALRQSLSGLHVGRMLGLAVLGRALIVLGGEKLLLWNLVDGGVEWEFALADIGVHDAERTAHLAVDPLHGTFAVAFAGKRSWRIAVFEARGGAEPVHLENLHAPVSALKAAGAGRGYMLLDCHARVQYLSPSLAPHVSVAHTSKNAGLLRQEEGEEEEAGLVGGYAATELAARRPEEEEEEEEAEEVGVTERVVPREALENVLDVPAYAAGPVEEAFEKVFKLFAKKAWVDGEEDGEVMAENIDMDVDGSGSGESGESGDEDEDEDM